MWFSGNDGTTYRIGYATSPDGINWTKHLSNPVLNLGLAGSWDNSHVYYPSVIFDGTSYRMWYAGWDGSSSVIRIGYAYSLDGVAWTKHPANPVLDRGTPGSWDDQLVYTPMVFLDSVNSTYSMWFSGFDGSSHRIGYATSPDGLSWTKHPANPVIDVGPPGSWDDLRAFIPFVLHDGTNYQMWFVGYDGLKGGQGLATSPDGISWTKLIGSEILDAYEINGIIAGSTHSISLDVPSTAELDMFIFSGTGGRDDAVASSTSSGAGIDESLSFTAPTAGDYLLVITNEDGGHGQYTVSFSQAQDQDPIAEAGGPYSASENSPLILDASGSSDPDGTIVSFDWDLDGDGNYDDATGVNPTVNLWNDDYVGTICLMVTDDQNATDTDCTAVTINNVDPTASILSATMDCEIGLRVAGSKWSNVNLTLFENGTEIGFVEVERWPGNPSNNPSTGAMPTTTLDLTMNYEAVVQYDPYPDDGDEIEGDQPNNGKDKHNNAGNPVWLTLDCEGDSEWIHHTFNTQQTKKRGSDHWNHVEPWDVNINSNLVGISFTVEGSSTDPGSDDVSLEWAYGAQNVVYSYLNNPPSLDPYYSPYEGTAPVVLTESGIFVYSGPGPLTLTTWDDDEGQPTDTPGTSSISLILI
jgi:hypothetical protein